MDDPVILTVRFDADSEARFEAARERWFPPRLNVVPAHLTLFHKLPGEELGALRETVARALAGEAPFPARVATVVPLGGGWAFRVAAEPLDALRARLAKAFAPWLTAQDAQGFRAHVTIQNKVGRASAKACGEAIRAEFSPWEATVTGVRLWAYRGGPWEALDELSLGGGGDDDGDGRDG